MPNNRMIRHTVIYEDVYNNLTADKRNKIDVLYKEFESLGYIDATLVLPDQNRRMTKNQIAKNQEIRLKVFDIEDKIKQLLKSDEQLADELYTYNLNKAKSRLRQIDNHIKIISEIGVGKNGQIKPSYQKDIDKHLIEKNNLIFEYPEIL